MQWVKFNLEKKLHCVFVNVSESFVLLSRHKIDVKEDLISKHDVNKNVDTVHKMKFSITNFFSKCDQIRNTLRIWSHLLKKSLMRNFIFCVVRHSTVTLGKSCKFY